MPLIQNKKNYQVLFDAIEQQARYDEVAIKTKFKGKTFTKQLHVTKNYLTRLILKSLRNYHTELSKSAVVHDLLRNIEILYNKELYTHCAGEIKKAIQLASKYELFPAIIEAQTWHRKLHQTMQPGDFQSLLDIHSNQKMVMNQLENLNYYWESAINHSAVLFGNENIQLQENQLIEDEAQALSTEAKGMFYTISYLRCLKNKDEAEAKSALVQLILTLEDKPHLIQEKPILYVTTINNLLSLHVFRKEINEAFDLLKKVKNVYKQWRNKTKHRSLLRQIMRTFNIELEIYRTTNLLENKQQFINQIELFVDNYSSKIPKNYQISFWFQLASAHFSNKNFDQSMTWINRVMNCGYKDIRTDLQNQIRLLNLMVHFEQKNLMVLRYFVESTRRYLKKARQVQLFERRLFKFFAAIGHEPESKYQSLFEGLYNDLYPKASNVIDSAGN